MGEKWGPIQKAMADTEQEIFDEGWGIEEHVHDDSGDRTLEGTEDWDSTPLTDWGERIESDDDDEEEDDGVDEEKEKLRAENAEYKRRDNDEERWRAEQEEQAELDGMQANREYAKQVRDERNSLRAQNGQLYNGRLADSMRLAHMRHGDEFVDAWNNLISMDPNNYVARAHVNQIVHSPDPGEAVVAWNQSYGRGQARSTRLPPSANIMLPGHGGRPSRQEYRGSRALEGGDDYVPGWTEDDKEIFASAFRR